MFLFCFFGFFQPGVNIGDDVIASYQGSSCKLGGKNEVISESWIFLQECMHSSRVGSEWARTVGRGESDAQKCAAKTLVVFCNSRGKFPI